MKIQSIKISNILSFEYKANINECEEIKLNESLNILIGPNGAGKSNFLEILNQLFKTALFKQFIFEQSVFNRVETGDQNNEAKNVIQMRNDIKYQYLTPNKYSNKQEQEIKIVISLNNNDKENIDFIFNNAEKINGFINQYSNTGFQFDINEITPEVIESNMSENLSLAFKNNHTEKKFIKSETSEPLSKIQKLMVGYLEYFDLIQKIIELKNLKEGDGDEWRMLKNTFALIGCHRNYDNIDPNYSTNQEKHAQKKQITDREINENTTKVSNNSIIAFDHIKNRLSYQFFDKAHLNDEDIYSAIEEDKIFKSINKFLCKFLKIKLKFTLHDRRSWLFNFSFIQLNRAGEETDEAINVGELSSGQKGIIHFIFSVFGYDLRDGLLIIDEPELHLHPQTQKQYIEVIQKAGVDFGLQFIIVTHSPVFVEPETINAIHRFYKDDYTKIAYCPHISEDTSAKELTRILNFTNSSKIFFTKKVILVEGKSDEYFFRFFLDKYFKEHSGEEEIDPDIEIVSIEGKRDRQLWCDFLGKFHIKTYFIGDWDNVINFNFLGDVTMQSFKKEYSDDLLKAILDSIKEKSSEDGKTLLKMLIDYIESPKEDMSKVASMIEYLFSRHTPHKKLIEYLSEDHTEEMEAINKKIEAKYEEGIFILKIGELEDYLNIKKDLTEVIEFCEDENFNRWYQEENDAQKELKIIFEKITLD